MKISKRMCNCAKGEIAIFTISNSSGAEVELSNLGAGVTRIVVPDAHGRLADVALGYANPADYLYDGPCAGKTPGRFANRIACGKFELDGREYQLAVNNPPNALHGGPDGFHNRLWNYAVIENGVIFSYYSADGEEGYPGNVKVEVKYTWSERNELEIDYSVTTDAPTIINLTNHTYFNLSGEGSGSCLEHELQLSGSRWLPADNSDIPFGDIARVDDTPMDFRRPKALDKDIDVGFYNLASGKGYNHFFLVDDWQPDGKMRQMATLIDHKSGRILDVETTQCGAMLYTGNWLADSPVGKCGRSYADYDGVAIECQGAPDAPNHSNFPSTVLRPGERYHHVIKYHFSTIKT